MNLDYCLRAGFIILACLVCAAAEMKRRARVTGEVARRWLETGGYRIAGAESMKINVWANPARVTARADDAEHNAVDVALAVKWFMGGVLGQGEVTCISIKNVGRDGRH